VTDDEVFDFLVELNNQSRNGNLVERASASLRLKEEVLLNFEALLRLAAKGLDARDRGPRWRKFNIDHEVRVRLTDAGRRIDSHWSLHTDENGWTKYRMCDLIRKFGGYVYVGSAHVPFEMEIEIDLGE
jgi:hypothetical protein